MRAKYPPKRPLNPAQQLGGLRMLYPESCGRLIKDKLIWAGHLRPSPFSRDYLVRIEYHLGGLPRTRVLEPNIRTLAGDRKIPHLYPEVGDPLCLFYAPAREWRPHMSIANTVVPWACEWLLHFEAWLLTGEWDGGGIHIRRNPPHPQPAGCPQR